MARVALASWGLTATGQGWLTGADLSYITECKAGRMSSSSAGRRMDGRVLMTKKETENYRRSMLSGEMEMRWVALSRGLYDDDDDSRLFSSVLALFCRRGGG